MIGKIDKDHLPNLADIKKCTTIKINGLSTNGMISDMVDKLSEKFEFIPPVFEEYVIKSDNIDLIKQSIEDECCDIKMSPEEKEKTITRNLTAYRKQFKNFDDIRYDYIFVKWKTETSFDLIYFAFGKKRLYISVQYIYDEQANMTFDGDIDVLSKSWIDSLTEDELNGKANSIILLMLAVSDYLLNYTDKVEYVLDDKPHKKVKKSDSPSKSAKASKTDRSNIYYKSAVKVYEIFADDILNRKKRKYRKIKQSWFVRGYYQRYGKEKIPRYIPPRINHRQGVTESPKIGNIYKLDVPESKTETE